MSSGAGRENWHSAVFILLFCVVFFFIFIFFYFIDLWIQERENIHCLQVISTSYFWLCLGLSMLEGEFFSQCWIPVVLKLQKQRRKQLRTDRFRGSGLTPLPQELLSSNLMSSQCQTVRRTGKNTELIPLYQGNKGVDTSGGRASWYFSMTTFLIWKSITKSVIFFPSIVFLFWVWGVFY